MHHDHKGSGNASARDNLHLDRPPCVSEGVGATERAGHGASWPTNLCRMVWQWSGRMAPEGPRMDWPRYLTGPNWTGRCIRLISRDRMQSLCRAEDVAWRCAYTMPGNDPCGSTTQRAHLGTQTCQNYATCVQENAVHHAVVLLLDLLDV